MNEIKHIALVPNGTKDKGYQITQAVVDILLAHGATLTVEESCAIPPREGLHFVKNKNQLLQQAQLVITLGGDGTILHIAREAALRELPILGINMGRVGFMAELEVKKLDLLKRLFEGKFGIEERIMLEVCINGRESHVILNDAVITAQRRRMIDMQLWENESQLGLFRGDGLILSTPTGSTAYCLSAGGPVVDPRLSMLLAVPICPHSLSSRPIVFAPDATLRIRDFDGPAQLSLDGKDVLLLSPDDEVRVKRAGPVTRLVQLCDRQFYTAVRSYFS